MDERFSDDVTPHTPGQLPLWDLDDHPGLPASRAGLRTRPVVAAAAASVTALSLLGWGIAGALTGSTDGLPGVQRLSTTSSSSPTTMASRVERSIVDIVASDGGTGSEDAGTGMVLTADGDILTNNHVVDGATALRVTALATGRTYQARVVGTDATDDIAVIKLIGDPGLTPITAGDSQAVSTGTRVVAIGNAEGRGTPTVTTGTITGTDRSITAGDGGGSSERLHGLLETDAEIISGDSGGPLADTAGQVIGMDTAAAESGGQPSFGMPDNVTASTDGYAIPIADALSIAQRIVGGHASSTIVIGSPGMLGVEVGDGSSGMVAPFGAPGGLGGATTTTGADVGGVLSSGPAAAAGITAGSVITRLDGHAVASAAALTSLLAKTHGGDTVRVTWTDTAGTSHTARVTLAAGPAA
jgi:S1-C subfamily serine protease